jgi:hypothetical protein
MEQIQLQMLKELLPVLLEDLQVIPQQQVADLWILQTLPLPRRMVVTMVAMITMVVTMEAKEVKKGKCITRERSLIAKKPRGTNWDVLLNKCEEFKIVWPNSLQLFRGS